MFEHRLGALSVKVRASLNFLWAGGGVTHDRRSVDSGALDRSLTNGGRARGCARGMEHRAHVPDAVLPDAR